MSVVGWRIRRKKGDRVIREREKVTERKPYDFRKITPDEKQGVPSGGKVTNWQKKEKVIGEGCMMVTMSCKNTEKHHQGDYVTFSRERRKYI